MYGLIKWPFLQGNIKKKKKLFSIISQGPITVPLEFEIWVGNTVYTNLNLGVFDISNY